MQKIIPYLWFDSQAEEAAEFYTSIFKNSRIVGVHRNGPDGQGPEGSAMLVTFELEGQRFMALNGGPAFKCNEAISLYVDCETQEEVDALWEKLSANPAAEQCGWLKDRYGVSWQIIPRALPELMSDPDPERAGRVMKAMLQMKKIDIRGLKQAYEGQ